MKRLWIVLFLIIIMWGCEEKNVENTSTPIPPILSTPESGDIIQNYKETRFSVSQKAMEVFSKILDKPIEQITKEDFLEITFYSIDSEEDNIDSSFHVLENLERLYINHQLEDYSFIKDLPNLQMLATITVDTLEFLKGHKKLETLVIQVTDSIDFGPLSTLEQLKILSIYSSTIDIAQIPVIEGLEELILTADKLYNIDALANFPTLKKLQLTPIRHHEALTSLNFQNTVSSEFGVENINFVKHLPDLQKLSLSYTAVEDLTSIVHATELTSLNLYFTKVSDLTPLANLQKLETLHIGETPVTTIEPLLGLRNLKYITLDKDKVLDWQLLKEKPDLEIQHSGRG